LLVYQSQELLRSSAPGGLLKHLEDCILQPLDVQRKAVNDPSRKVKGHQGSSPSGPRSSLALAQFGPPDAGPRIGCFHPYFTPGGTTSIPLESGSDSGSLAVPSPFHVPRSRSPAVNQHLSVKRGGGSTISRVSSTDSITPSESASRTSSRFGDRRRSSFRIIPGSDNLAIVPWNEEKRRRFQHYIVRLTASAGFSLSWVENNVWHSFLEEFLPSAPKISRKVLTKRILPDAVKEVQEKIKKSVAGKEVTMQGDGWTGINNEHLLAFMITCDKKVSYLIRYLIKFSNVIQGL
jgi:hypothetical protein